MTNIAANQRETRKNKASIQEYEDLLEEAEQQLLLMRNKLSEARLIEEVKKAAATWDLSDNKEFQDWSESYDKFNNLMFNSLKEMMAQNS